MVGWFVGLPSRTTLTMMRESSRLCWCSFGLSYRDVQNFFLGSFLWRFDSRCEMGRTCHDCDWLGVKGIDHVLGKGA